MVRNMPLISMTPTSTAPFDCESYVGGVSLLILATCSILTRMTSRDLATRACRAGSLSPLRISSVWPSHSTILTTRLAAKSSSSAPLRGTTCPNTFFVAEHLTTRHLIKAPEALAASSSSSPAGVIGNSSSLRVFTLSPSMKK